MSAWVCALTIGVVTSMNSAPKASSARAISILSPCLKFPRANCSPSRRVESMIAHEVAGIRGAGWSVVTLGSWVMGAAS